MHLIKQYLQAMGNDQLQPGGSWGSIRTCLHIVYRIIQQADVMTPPSFFCLRNYSWGRLSEFELSVSGAIVG